MMNVSKLSIAPMIDWTNMPFRVLMRLLAPHALLYTEMQTPGAIKHAPQKALNFIEMEHPIALQLGGSHPAELRECAKIAEARGFDEINLNLGCPSDRVQAGRFGACLMNEPQLVAQGIRAMKDAVSIPVTAKTRIGVDHQDDYAFFADFIQTIVASGCDKVIVHARKAWLKGLSPKQNRTIPPINYDYVYRIKQEISDVPIVINGHITSIETVAQHLTKVDGVMIGRLACQNAYEIAKIHASLFPNTPLITRELVLDQYMDYLSRHAPKLPMSFFVKPILSLTHGLANARQWRQNLSCIQKNGKPENLINFIRNSIESANLV